MTGSSRCASHELPALLNAFTVNLVACIPSKATHSRCRYALCVQVPDLPGPIAVTVDGATTSCVSDDVAAEVQEEQVELVAERIEAMRAKQGEEVRHAVNDLQIQTDLCTPSTQHHALC